MAKITRTKNFIPFGGSATTTSQRVIFDAAGGTFSDDFDTNQTPEFEEGWSGVGDPTTTPPTSQRDTAAVYQTGRAVQLLMQQGIENWVKDQEMYFPCAVMGSDGQIYVAKDGSFDSTVDPVLDGGTNWVLKGEGNVVQDVDSTIDEEIIISDGTTKKTKGSGKLLSEYQDLITASSDITLNSVTGNIITNSIDGSGNDIVVSDQVKVDSIIGNTTFLTLGDDTETNLQTSGDDSLKLATTSFVQQEILSLIKYRETSGQVKINSFNGVSEDKPTITVTTTAANTFSGWTNLEYGASLNLSTITDFPLMDPNKNDASIWDDTNKKFRENNSVNQRHAWRIILNYSRTSFEKVQMIVRLYNEDTGFEAPKRIYFSEERQGNPDTGTEEFELITYADSDSLSTDRGYFLQVGIYGDTGASIDLTLDSITRASLPNANENTI